MKELISQSNRSIVYKEAGTNIEPVIWKVCSHLKNTSADLVNEFDITGQLHIPGVRRPLKKGVYENQDAFSYYFFDGVPLKTLIAEKEFSLKEFLQIAKAITRLLVELHETGIYHFRINSYNILYNPQTASIELIDFSLAGTESLHHHINFQDWGSEVAYMAPEQTGRLHQMIDGRTDLYSLGIVFYEILAGRLPFSHPDNANLVHMHLVQMPTSLISISSKIPSVVSEIIDKLLCKNPDERYQTAYSLEKDINTCIEMYEAKEVIAPFKLATQDELQRVKLTGKIYGRSDEIKNLQAGLERAMNGGSELYLISGEAGTGKTAIAEQISKSVLDKEGVILTVKFNQLKVNAPHISMINVLKELATVILSESDDLLSEWKYALKKAIKDNEELIFELVPELKWVIGAEETEVVDEFGYAKKSANFNLVFQRILHETASLKKLLIFFADDLQWADSASWETIYSLLNDAELIHFMLICCYRDDKPEKDKYLENNLKKIRDLKPGLVELRVANLNRTDIEIMIEESFSFNEPGQLSDLIYTKTLGNPFFVHQLLNTALKNKTLSYSGDKNHWIWNKEKLEKLRITDNVAGYMADNVKLLPLEIQEVLMYASCIGSEFNITILSQIVNKSKAALYEMMRLLINEGFVGLKKDNIYLFRHDRISHTIYKIIPEDKRTKIHFSIATALVSVYNNEQDTSTLYEIAGHFEIARKIIPHKDVFSIIEYILKAGLKAKHAAAFEQSHHYLSFAISLLNSADWDKHYEFVLNLHYEATEVALAAGKSEEAEKLLEVSTTRARTLKDSIKAHEIKLNHLSENHRFPETIAHLLQVLKEIGFPIKRNPGKLTILKEYAVIKWHLKNKKINAIPSIPLMDNERALIFLRLTVNSLTSIFGAAPDILPLVIFKQVQLSLKYGNSVYAPFAYCFYGFALCVFVGDLEKGYRFGKMSLQLADQLHADVVKSKVMVSFYGFLSYWVDSIRTSVLPLREAYEIGRKVGDHLYAAFALSFHTSIRLHSGDNLVELLDNMTEDCATIKAMNQDLVYNISESQRQYVINFAREVEDPLILNNEGFDEDLFLQTLEKTNDEASKFDFYFYKMSLACIFNEYDVAFENSKLAAKYEDETTSRQITYPAFILFSAIAFIKYIEKKNLTVIEKKKIYRRIRKQLKLLKGFSKHAPQNFENKYTLVQAFIAEYKGKTEKSAELFYRSINQAQKSYFIHEEALAREHFAYFYFSIKRDEFGELMLKKSFECYQKWGAYSKCDQLKKKFPGIFKDVSVKDVNLNMSALQNIYDLNTIIKVNHALSSENTPEGLLRKMLEIVMQNASVTYGVIILKSENEKLISLAAGSNEKITIFDKYEEQNKKLFPASVVNYAARIKSVFVSDNFREEKKFSFDVYNQSNHPVSVCAIPIIINDRVLGILYLENNLAEAAFDSRRIEFFKTISSQLAISLDNAFLYAEMEQKVKVRTTELMSKNVELTNEKKKSDDLLLNILPRETATELKNFGKTSARRYNSVTILFSDIKSFSAIAETLSPEDLVSELDFIFKKFDEVSLKYNLEKIKTIGDAYMAVGGLPENNKATPKDVVEASIEMLEFIKDLIEIRKQQVRQFFEIRIGIHTGPVIAGVVGDIKFQYDIWGDTVNLAARMEQNSEPGKVNISHATYNLVKDSFNCIYRGKIRAKNMGDVDMYFVEGQNNRF